MIAAIAIVVILAIVGCIFREGADDRRRFDQGEA